MAKKDLNMVVLTGRLTADIEKRVIGQGEKAFTAINFNIAVNRAARQVDGEWKQEADFVPVTMAGRGADYIAEHAHKGDEVIIEGGTIESYTYEKDGQKRYGLRVKANNARLGDKKQQTEHPAQPVTDATPTPTAEPVQEVEETVVGIDISSDDLPF